MKSARQNGPVIIWTCEKCGRDMTQTEIALRNMVGSVMLACPGKAYDQCNKSYMVKDVLEAVGIGPGAYGNTSKTGNTF